MAGIWMAPMEGVTDAALRRVHHACFTGVDRYYIPFISPTQNFKLTGREKRNVLPEQNAGVPCVPQVLAKDAAYFLWAAKLLADWGYDEVNLNTGCPSGTVTAKGKGAGFLRTPDALSAFLDEVCAKSPIPVSVKTRIGFDSTEEWPRLMEIFSRYPLKHLIIHPRTCRERYAPGTVHREAFEAAVAMPFPTAFNGDIFTVEQGQALLREHPDTSVMLGRGLLANPALGRQLKGGEPLERQELRQYHDMLFRVYRQEYIDAQAFPKLRIIMKHIACCFEGAAKLERAIRKSRSLDELEEIDRRLFDQCPLKEQPCYHDDDTPGHFTDD